MTRTRHSIGGYREFAPSPETAGFCEAFWIHRTPEGPAVPGAAHRVLPEVAVCLGFQTFRDEDGCPVGGGPILVGPKLRTHIFDLVPGRELAAIRLKPEWVAPILGIQPLDVAGQVVDLGQVLPALGARLHEELWRTRSAGEALDVLAQTVVETRASQTAPSAAASAALEIVRRTAGRLPCERVADRLGLSTRHLRRHVHDSTGFSPKSYARVKRFVSSILLADTMPQPSWADIAAGAGYCDQSHFIRDSIDLAGLTPRELLAERRRQVVGASTAVAERSNPGE
jgi:AraC-like DNA-binding protein